MAGRSRSDGGVLGIVANWRAGAHRWWAVSALTLVSIVALTGAGGGAYAPRPGQRQPSAAELEALGRSLFFAPALSASGRQSCASCHDPAHAFGPPNDLAVQLGGPDGRTPGLRAVPSLRYLHSLRPFGEHVFDNDGDDSIDTGPAGGHSWDGRASSAHDQARLPLLSPLEMGNASEEAIVARLAQSPLRAQFDAVFGADLFTKSPAEAFEAVLMALEVFQQSPREFYPYNSKYDQVLRGKATLSAQEVRGLALFNDEAKGNCASCHPSAIKADGAFPLFTDHGHIALGLPRNREIAANADPAFFDLGLCGPLRTDLRARTDYCGMFRAPSLRNVAVRQRFFHNGVVRSLEDAVRFYVERDARPERWFPPGAGGAVDAFDDLPLGYRGQVNVDPPFGQKAGAVPVLDESEIRDVVAFLRTLTDSDQVRSGP